MSRAPHLTADPARDAASVLRRMGFVVLMIGLPLAAFAFGDGVLVVSLVGIILVAAAALFDGAPRPLRASLDALAAWPALPALAILLGWTLLSLAWSSSPRAGAAEFGAFAAVLGLALVGYLALPDRMRSANLYVVPVGAAAAALVAIVLALMAQDAVADTERRLARGLAVLVVYAWPGVAWLRSRGRDVSALLLAAVVAVAAAVAPDTMPAVAFALGAVAYLVAQLFGRGAMGIGIATALLVAGAPLLVAFGLPHLEGAGFLAPWASALEGWRSSLVGAPLRWLTGHGEGSLAAQPAWPLDVFGTPALILWFELGIVGALAAAAAIGGALWTAVEDGPLLPGMAAALTTAAVMALTGFGAGEMWWPAAIAIVVVVFVAAERGQFRTRRPRALSVRRAVPARR